MGNFKFAVPSAILIFVSCASAQVSLLPECALGCATQAATEADCSVSDNPCLCNSPGFASSVVGCAPTAACSPEEQSRISDILEDMCDAGSASGTVSASVSPPGSSTPSGSASVTIVPPPISLSTSAPPSSASGTSPSGSATSPASTSSAAPSTSPSTGAAQQNRMGRAGVVGALFAVALGLL